MIVHNQRTEHGTTLLIREHEQAEGPQEYVEVAIALEDEQPVLLSLTTVEARRFSDALLGSSQRVEDRRPHGNS